MGLDFVDQHLALARREHPVQIVQRGDAATVRGASGGIQLGDGPVDFGRADRAGSHAVGDGLQDGLVDRVRGGEASVQLILDLLDLGTLGLVGAEGIQAHGDELGDAAVVVVAVVLLQLCRGLIVAGRGLGIGSGDRRSARRRVAGAGAQAHAQHQGKSDHVVRFHAPSNRVGGSK